LTNIVRNEKILYVGDKIKIRGTKDNDLEKKKGIEERLAIYLLARGGRKTTLQPKEKKGISGDRSEKKKHA